MLRWVIRENSPIVTSVSMPPSLNPPRGGESRPTYLPLTLPQREAQWLTDTDSYRSKEPLMMTTPTTIDPAQLPDVITGYLIAHMARDLDRAVASYQPDATVT